ncbi:hypothetical protein LUZ61_000148 [Rhynchospora tenuis]|uniref:C2H2-type domain-containing protein n=1 Tax=Rhynchospora tenuis TaxID=198213 RepID=A0AAD5ZEU4_9POAL|nr:hypothetical protein LUZ61_000148 [Rhynchospora tenuis]
MNNAEKTLIHTSHLHPLQLVTSPEPKPICHACNMQCTDRCFGCLKCRYYLHITCATIKKRLDHPSHPAHTLLFELTPTYDSGKFGCNACGDEGSTFCLRCRECNYDLHLHCAALPHKVNHHSHNHPLSLVYENPNPHSNGTPYAYCELCKATVDVSKWFYRCNTCNFGGHVACFAPNTVEALSPGLQAPAPPPSPIPPQPQAASQVGNVTNEELQMQLIAAQAKAAQSMMVANAMHNAGNTFRYSFDNVQYTTRWM